jgi:hypothetical protein
MKKPVLGGYFQWRPTASRLCREDQPSAATAVAGDSIEADIAAAYHFVRRCRFAHGL